MTAVQWSELQRDPKAVAAMAETADVELVRRDGSVLILTAKHRAAAETAGAAAAARLLRNLLAHGGEDVIAGALLDEFTWADALPAEERWNFVRDFTRAFQTSTELGSWSSLAQTVVEWRSTAAIFADKHLAEDLRTPIDGDFGPVPPPVEG